MNARSAILKRDFSNIFKLKKSISVKNLDAHFTLALQDFDPMFSSARDAISQKQVVLLGTATFLNM